MVFFWCCEHQKLTTIKLYATVDIQNHTITLWMNRKRLKRWSFLGEFSFNLIIILIWLLLLTAQLSNMTAMTAGQGSMLHLQSNMQHSPLGISIINTHSGSVSFKTLQEKKCVMFYRVGWQIILYIRFTDVSILHEWAALTGIPVPYLSLPADTPAGVLSNPNWTTGTKR